MIDVAPSSVSLWKRLTGSESGWSLLLTYVAPLATLCWSAVHFWWHTVDDAFISLRYSANLADSGSLAYNPGQVVEGYSNFLLVILASLAYRLGFDPLHFVKALGLLAALLLVVVSASLAKRCSEENERWIAAPVAAWLIAFNISIAFWAVAGLETTLFALLLAAAVLAYETELADGHRVPASALLFFLAYLTRPEAPGYLLYFLLRRAAQRQPVTRRDAIWLATCLGLIVAYELWGYWYFGAWLPHTYAAKSAAKGFQLWPQPLLTAFFFGSWPSTLLLAIAAVGLVRSRSLKLPLLIPALLVLGFVCYARRDWMPRFRFFVAGWPFFASLIGVGIAHHVSRLPRPSMRQGATWATALLVCGYGAFQWYTDSPSPSAHSSLLTRRPLTWFATAPGSAHSPIPTLGAGLVATAILPDKEGFAIRDIGMAGYVRPGPIFDLAGLVTPGGIRYRDVDRAREGLVAGILDERPGLISIPTSRDYSPCLLSSLLENDPRLKGMYRRVASARLHTKMGVAQTSRNRARGLVEYHREAWLRADLSIPPLRVQRQRLLAKQEFICGRLRDHCDVVRAIIDSWPRSRTSPRALYRIRNTMRRRELAMERTATRAGLPPCRESRRIKQAMKQGVIEDLRRPQRQSAPPQAPEP